MEDIKNINIVIYNGVYIYDYIWTMIVIIKEVYEKW